MRKVIEEQINRQMQDKVKQYEAMRFLYDNVGVSLVHSMLLKAFT